MAWTEQRLKQSGIAWLSADLDCWGSGLRLCTTLLSACLPAVPASMSFNKLRKGQGLSACNFCLPFVLWGQNTAELAVVCGGAWDEWVYPVSMRLLSSDLGNLAIFFFFLSDQNSCAEVWCCWCPIFNTKAHLSLVECVVCFIRERRHFIKCHKWAFLLELFQTNWKRILPI